MKHWSMKESDEIAMLGLDLQGHSANVLSKEVMAELNEIISEISVWGINKKQPELPKGLIIYSKKPGGFILGADVNEFKSIDLKEEAEKLALHGQSVLDALEKLPFPTVAAINGYALGGGLELALACKYRIAADNEKTRLGLPEVLLGIHPGFGGTVRLPRLIGGAAALEMMLTGKIIDARSAKKLGLVDEAVSERHLLSAAIFYVNRRPKTKKLPFGKRFADYPLIRQIAGKIIKRKIGKKANPKYYPAPYSIIDLWVKKAGLREEAKSLGELMVGKTSRNLVNLFLVKESLKRTAKTVDRKIKHVHIVGAGTMGADIAAWIASKGYPVSIDDQSLEILARAAKRAQEFFKKKFKDPYLARQAADKLIIDPQRNWLKKADLIIEAIIENKEAKQALFKEIEKQISKETILATNTSGIPLEAIAGTLTNPSRLVGLHFFNPVAKMDLVEVIRGKETNGEIFKRALAFAASLDKLPLEVKSSPGFLVNRCLTPYLFEALTMLEGGISKEIIDQSAVDFGMPMGPFALMDAVGLDICLNIGDELEDFVGRKTPTVLREMVAKGKLGIKSKKGFYKYDKIGKPKIGRAEPDPMVAVRLIGQIVKEANKCLKEGIVDDFQAINIGMVFGTGFAPFRGGPLSL
ncbi:MAG: 3-hydroxyacyl-CoA dehydrogenase NAD-binding domain-containing protein [Patescibacteria group bacterium]